MKVAVEQKVAKPYSRLNPFPAKILKNINLNKDGSNKETIHLELSLSGSGLSYLPGDTLGIVPQNDPELVTAIIEEMKWDEETPVVVNKKEGTTLPIKEALLNEFDITRINKKILQTAAEYTENEALHNLLLAENAKELRAYTDGRDFLDMLREFGPWNGTAEEIVEPLRKLLPRLYSIASSEAANPEEVHLTISAVRYTAHGRDRKGVCSVFIAERLEEGDSVLLYMQPNKRFRLPELDKDIIMVGPGTGIAPFRSFLQERAVTKAPGKSWLFFGDQHKAYDFLYEEELEQFAQDGALTKLDLAFSRDTDEKVYVQHRMLENSKELFEWLENGAHFYVCGDKTHMAKDVNDALISIIETEGNMSNEDAEAYLKEMSDAGRYQRDVY